jgi:alpha-galactosidase
MLRQTLLIVLFSTPLYAATTTRLDELDLSSASQGWGTPHKNKSVEGHTLTIAGKTFPNGFGTHAPGRLLLDLPASAGSFTASVGVDDDAHNNAASVVFQVLGDGKILFDSGVMRWRQPAKEITVDLNNLKHLELRVTDADDGESFDHADWASATFSLDTGAPTIHIPPTLPPYILTPAEKPEPQIHSPKIFGVRPNHPLLYTIAATGTRPMTFSADNLPASLSLDSATGQITGALSEPGDHLITLHAKNSLGETSRPLKLVVGDTIALTPPMGWNSWNCWASSVSDEKVRASADAMVSSGLINHGWTYINIDDCWENRPDTKIPNSTGPQRDADGRVITNSKFPNMKSLADYVHSKGLRIGIYSSPGPTTCGGYTASYQHELDDAAQYAAWGFDYLKYDWCSYHQVSPHPDLDALKKPYEVMRAALDKQPRDILFSLCQYGMGDVWKWGATVGGNCWRTTGDIRDSWDSMSRIGFNQAGHELYAGPGHWNDPDMLVVGKVGWGPALHPTHLTPDEQYTHISLWCLLDAPLLIGCDMTQLDPFTLSLLTNDEVLSVSQDPLGKQASRISKTDSTQIFAKDMEDGSKAVGLFNLDEDPQPVTLHFSDLKRQGPQSLHDLWRQKDLGSFTDTYTTPVPGHGVVLISIKKD